MLYLLSESIVINLNNANDMESGPTNLQKGETITIHFDQPYGGVLLYDMDNIKVTATYGSGSKSFSSTSQLGIDLGEKTGKVEIKANSARTVYWGATIFDQECKKRIYSTNPYTFLYNKDVCDSDECYSCIFHQAKSTISLSNTNESIPAMKVYTVDNGESILSNGVSAQYSTKPGKPLMLMWNESNDSYSVSILSYSDGQEYKVDKKEKSGKEVTIIDGTSTASDESFSGNSITGLVFGCLFFVFCFVLWVISAKNYKFPCQRKRDSAHTHQATAA